MIKFVITEPGQYWTRSGHIATVWRRTPGTPDAATFPWMGHINLDYGTIPATWTDRGEYIRGGNNPRDLVSAVRHGPLPPT